MEAYTGFEITGGAGAGDRKGMLEMIEKDILTSFSD